MRHLEEDDCCTQETNKPRIISSSNGTTYEFYLLGEVLEPSTYLEWFHTIRHATENDLIILYINSPGGNATTAIQFLSVLEDTDAQILIQVEGMCASAATLIFMKAHAFSIANHSEFLFHNYSDGAIGKGGELKEKISHQSKWAEKLLKDTYKYFFNDNEIQQILDGKDFWMDKDEVIERMKHRLDQFKKEFESAEKAEKASAKTKKEKAVVKKISIKK